MTKKMSAAWLICFAVLLLFPRIVYQFTEKSQETENTENRVMAAKPDWKWDMTSLQAYPSAYESYYNDRLAFRGQMIEANSILDLKLFRDPASESVMLGKENWLFYREENCIEDYKGLNLFTDEQLEAVKDNLLTSKAFLDERGIEFVLLIPPNKETIYGGRYLPDYIEKRSDTTRAEQLIEYLRANTDLRIVYPKEELMRYSEQYSLYWHYDTHWNPLGGYIGAKALLKELGIEIVDVEEIQITEDDFSGYDLANLMKLKDFYMDHYGSDISYQVTGYEMNGMTIDQEIDATELIYHSDAPDRRKLFLVRDSFAGGMAHVLASNFAATFMPHWNNCFTQSMIDEQQPDIFVYELVERRLDALFEFRLSD